jgi:nitric oxide reductase NorD protein
MAEPEELIVEGAYVTTRFARTIWRRYRVEIKEPTLLLRDARWRLELFVGALVGAPIRIAEAESAAPRSWLARFRRHGPALTRRHEATPGTDGMRLYLPASLPARDGVDAALEMYRLLALQQAVRLLRGSATLGLSADAGEIRDRFLAAEAAVVDRWIMVEAPGIVPRLKAARLEALACRPDLRTLTPREQEVERLVRGILCGDESYSGPLDAASDALLVSARTQSGEIVGRYRGLQPVWYWGTPVRPSRAVPCGPAGDHERETSVRRSSPRVAEMRRRPRVREAADDEEDTGTGTWIIRADEPQESVEDPFGLQRPVDREQNADPEGLGDSLSELPEARVIRTPEEPREILRAGDDRLPTTSGTAEPRRATGIAYPEWDYRRGAYVDPGAVIRETVPTRGDDAWVEAALVRHRRLIHHVKAVFGRLRPRRIDIGRQSDGTELDIAACVTAAADVRASSMVDDRLYIASRRARRRIAIALLADVSASTDGWVTGDRRIVDVEKEALLVVCEALEAVGDRYAILAFSGEGPAHVCLMAVKRFAESLSPEIRRRIAGLDADRYTRLGAAIRHASAMLAPERADRPVLIILSDGKPNDVDVYEGPYGVEDSRQAVAEARRQGIHVRCLTVDREAPRYAHRIFGATGFARLPRADRLPMVLVEMLRGHLRG